MRGVPGHHTACSCQECLTVIIMDQVAKRDEALWLEVTEDCDDTFGEFLLIKHSTNGRQWNVMGLTKGEAEHLLALLASFLGEA